MTPWLSAGILLVVAFGLNLPLGRWRASQPKFSPAWFIGIHASIPVLIALRFALEMSYWFIPPEVALVLAGQIVGARVGLPGPTMPQAAEPSAGAES